MKLSHIRLFICLLSLILNYSLIICQVPELILPIGHSDVIRYASYSRDGKKIATVSNDRTVKIWNADNGSLLITIDGFSDRNIVSTVAFSPDSKSIMTLSEDKSVRIWSPANGKLLHEFIDRDIDGSRIMYSPDGLYLLQIQDTVTKIWDTNNGSLLKTGCQSYIFDPLGNIILTVSSDGSAKIWDIVTGNLIRSIVKTGYSAFSEAIFSPDGKYHMTRSESETNILATDSGNELFTISTISSTKPCFSPDSKKVLAVGNLYNRNGKWKNEREISLSFTVDSGGLWGPIPALYEAASGKMLFTYLDSATIDIENDLVGNGVPYYSVGFSPNGKNIIMISDKCRVWDAAGGILLYTIEGQYDERSSFIYSPDSRRIILITGTDVRLFDAVSGKLIHSYEAPNFRMNDLMEEIRQLIPTVGLSKSGKDFFIISSNSNSANIWDVQSGELRLNLTGHSSPVSQAVFSADGKNILTKSFYKGPTTKIWDIVNGKILHSFEGTEWASAVFGNEGKKISTIGNPVSGKTSLRTWDAISGSLLSNTELQADINSRYKFSPDYNTLVAIDTNFNAKVIDAITGTELFKLEGLVGEAKYKHDGKTIVATSWFDFINIWDVENGKLIYVLKDQRVSGYGDTAGYKMMEMDSVGNSRIKEVFVTKDMPFAKYSDDAKMYVTGKVKNIEFSEDGRNIIDPDGWNFATRLWEIQRGFLKNSFSGNRAAINYDGSRVLTYDYNDEYGSVAKIWDSQTDSLLYKLEPDRFQLDVSRFSPDGKDILTISHDSVKIWDSLNGRKKNSVYFSGTFCDIDWKGGRLLVHNNSKLVLFDINTGKELYSIIAIDSMDYIILTPDKYYMCSKNAANKLAWRVGDQLYSFDQFDLQYNRPDIVLERLGNTDTSLIKMYRNAYEKRLRKSGFTEKMFSSEWHTPEMKILTSEDINGTSDNSTINLVVNGTDSKYNLDRLIVSVNGVPLYGANGLSLLEEKSDSIIKTITIRLSTGENNIRVSCMNEKGVESLKESVDILYNPPEPVKPQLFIIAMSVSEYKDSRYNLQYAVKDGKDITEMFNSLAIQKGNYSKITIDTLFNDKATKKRLLGLKSKLLGSNVDDQVILFVSGHGLLNRDMDFYFATYDIDFQKPEKRGISFNDLENIMDGVPARKKLLLMDACHSGEVDKEDGGGLANSNTTVSSGITFRGSIREYSFKGVENNPNLSGISLSNSFELMQELFAGLDAGTGTTVISAAAGKGYALESPQWNNGVFTYTLLNGMKNRAADKNGDGKITISELKNYSVKQVEILTGGRQKPTVRRESIGYDWSIW
jgi:WD40 repeat protein